MEKECSAGGMVEWQKSKASGDLGCCVEVSFADDSVAVRDSKQDMELDRTILRFTHEEWRAFIAGVKDGEFDL